MESLQKFFMAYKAYNIFRYRSAFDFFNLNITYIQHYKHNLEFVKH
jgi:hypothetical protein